MYTLVLGDKDHRDKRVSQSRGLVGHQPNSKFSERLCLKGVRWRMKADHPSLASVYTDTPYTHRQTHTYTLTHTDTHTNTHIYTQRHMHTHSHRQTHTIVLYQPYTHTKHELIKNQTQVVREILSLPSRDRERSPAPAIRGWEAQTLKGWGKQARRVYDSQKELRLFYLKLLQPLKENERKTERCWQTRQWEARVNDTLMTQA